MHTILLLYRSVVFAAATPDVSAGSGGGGSGGGEASLDFAVHVTKYVDHPSVLGGVRNHGFIDTDAATAENTSPNLLQSHPSVWDTEWVAAQARADAQAAAAAARKGIGIASEAGLKSGGDAEDRKTLTKELTDEELLVVQEIGEQLDTEVRRRVKK